MTRSVIALGLVAALAGCISRPVVSIPPASCARLIPVEWAEGVEAAPIPANEPQIPEWLGKPLTAPMLAAIVAPWAAGYVAMSGQLTKANGRTADAMTIMTRCEEMVNAARPD
jgi:hypothetical protein